MRRFVGLMSCSGEGHSRQFISSRLEKNVNTTRSLQDAQEHNMVVCVRVCVCRQTASRKDFRERTLWMCTD